MAVRRTVNIAGRVLIVAGVVVLLFTAYQLWGTSVQEAHTQADLRSQLAHEAKGHEARQAFSNVADPGKLPTGPPVLAPRTNDPLEGDPVGDITIPVIGVNQVVVEGTSTADLRKGPGHYIGTPLPGQGGNAAIAGHRTTYGHPFYNLDGVKVGDPIVVTTLQGVFVYDATRSIVVSPSDTSVIKNMDANWLTLTTCNPRFSASTRLVVQATLAHSRLFSKSSAPPAPMRTDPRSQHLAGDNDVQLADTLLWGFAALVLGAVILIAAWRFRRQRWAIYVLGVAGVLVVLWFFFGAVSPLLPASF
jgi:sortase A